MSLNSIEEIIEDFRQGKMAIIVDDEDRENEGDLVIPADIITAEHINFMAKYARGLICLPLTQDRCETLALPLMPKSGTSAHSTNFTMSIEAAEGVTTGISAADRATTIKAAVNINAKPEDIVQPGHIFPLIAEEGGVLVRAGHTEAGCDLARLAGYQAAAVIVEILNEDGSMARRPELEVFAQEHGLKIGSIEDLIRYRTENEKTVERILETPFSSEYGDFELIAFNDNIHKSTHMALVKGPIAPDATTLVRVHVQNPLYDMFAAKGGRGGWPLHDAMKRVSESDQGVVVVLTQPHAGASLLDHIKEHKNPNKPQVKSPMDLRTYGIGAQILADLGIHKMRLLSAPKTFHGLSGFNLEIIDYVKD